MLLTDDRGLTDEQRMMRDACRAFVDDHVIPFTRQHWQREWIMTPDERLPRKIPEVASEIGIRTLGVPEEFGGTPLDPKTQVQTYAIIAEEIARGGHHAIQDHQDPVPGHGGQVRWTRNLRLAECNTARRRRIRRSSPVTPAKAAPAGRAARSDFPRSADSAGPAAR